MYPDGRKSNIITGFEKNDSLVIEYTDRFGQYKRSTVKVSTDGTRTIESVLFNSSTIIAQEKTLPDGSVTSKFIDPLGDV